MIFKSKEYLIIFFLLLASSPLAFSQSDVFVPGIKVPPGFETDDYVGFTPGLQVPPDFDIPKDKVGRVRAASLPENFDYRDYGLTPVKAQGMCGSCWSFATTAVLQDVIKIKTNRVVNLSEQYLLDCNNDGYSCAGGWIPHDYHKNKGYRGAIDGNAYPYIGQQSSCAPGHTPVDKIDNWFFVDKNGDYNKNIKQALIQYGPIWTTIYVNSALERYRGGIFNQCDMGGNQVNHAVVIVGYGKDKATGVDYWIVKNSWGSSWGENGYFRIKSNCNRIGFASNYVVYKDGDNLPDPDPNPNPTPDPDPEPEPEPVDTVCQGETSTRSAIDWRLVNMTVKNDTAEPIMVYWLNFQGKRKLYGTIDPNYHMNLRSFVGHAWVAVSKVNGKCLSLVRIDQWANNIWIVR